MGRSGKRRERIVWGRGGVPESEGRVGETGEEGRKMGREKTPSEQERLRGRVRAFFCGGWRVTGCQQSGQ